MIIIIKHNMIDIFAIADIRYEILRYLDHFTLMRACCCKNWLATARRILSMVTHTNIISFGYMAACPNLVSITIHSMYNSVIYNKLRTSTLPNIRTVEYVEYDKNPGSNWYFVLEKCNNIENMVLTYNCEGRALYGDTIRYWVSTYSRIKKLTIQNVSVYVTTRLLDCSIPVTLARCSIHTWRPLTTTHNLIMLDCTISTW
jgi:hypothetical protein